MNANNRHAWNQLLDAARDTHTASVQQFCPYPEDVTPIDVTPHRIPVADLFENEKKLADAHPLAAAFINTSPLARWRETYKNTHAGADFLDRFGCYALIGDGGAFRSEHLRTFVVYMPPHLDYPWHHHPAEEVYLVLAGSAEFKIRGEANQVLVAGDSIHHQSNQPHAATTHETGMIAYVVWKGDLVTAPVWTDEPLMEAQK